MLVRRFLSRSVHRHGGVSKVLSPAVTPFAERHVALTDADSQRMLKELGCDSMSQLVSQVIPKSIRRDVPDFGDVPTLSEAEALRRMSDIAAKNSPRKPMIGLGYAGTVMPPVIQRNVFESPYWYTPYTPYQAEIAQGRLQALFNYQTMVRDLTGVSHPQASLLDEGSAAAEALCVSLAHASKQKPPRKRALVSRKLHGHVLEVLKTRAAGYGAELVLTDDVLGHIADADEAELQTYACAFVGFPDTLGAVPDVEKMTNAVARLKAARVVPCCATDLLACALYEPPGKYGFEIVFGNAQRFGVPMGCGGPHAAFFAVTSQHIRQLPGRLIGLSRDTRGVPALRMSLQTREQHIRREKAISNICTAQALLANISSFYAVWHGKEGLQSIAQRANLLARSFANAIVSQGLGTMAHNGHVFDSVAFIPAVGADTFAAAAYEIGGLEVRVVGGRPTSEGGREGSSTVADDSNLKAKAVVVAFDETSCPRDLAALLCAAGSKDVDITKSVLPPVTAAEGEFDAHPSAKAVAQLIQSTAAKDTVASSGLARKSDFLTAPVFKVNRSEMAMQRYIARLAAKDYGLLHGMIPLGSCTMKLNAASQLISLTNPSLGNVHPFGCDEHRAGYDEMVEELKAYLCKLTGLDHCHIEPNSGATGEYAGLLSFKQYHEANGQPGRDVVIIPASAHGTNPATAAMCGLRVKVVPCDAQGAIDVAAFKQTCEEVGDKLCGAMVTYPSTHGVFEEQIEELTSAVRKAGGLVYIDGANMNAQVGLTYPGAYGGDCVHLNLHKTFAIPHGGGGPGMGPICVREKLVKYLPRVSSSPYGSALVLPISYVYIRTMGEKGLQIASEAALLSANYMAKRLQDGGYNILYTNDKKRVAHEFILDVRPLKKSAGIDVVDISKRLLDYNFHGPTMSFPVNGTLMIEPTESEPLYEVDRFVDALLYIRKEIAEIERGEVDAENNVVKRSPHTMADVAAWDRSDAW